MRNVAFLSVMPRNDFPAVTELDGEEEMAGFRRSVTRRLIMPLGDLCTGQQVTRLLDRFVKIQHWPTERLGAEADRRLRETVQLAYAEVPFYRELYDDSRVKPESITGVGDLSRLPIVTKAMLRAAFPQRCTRKTRYKWHDHSTSGSSGQPFVSRSDAYSESEARALMFLRAMFSGYEPGIPIMQSGMTPDRAVVKRLKDLLLGVVYVSTYDLSDSAIDRYLAMLEQRRLAYFMGTAQSLYLFAQRALEVGFNHRLQGVVSWGSILHQRYLSAINRAFGCPVYDTYGVSEGMQVSAQCGEDHQEYHQFSFHVAAEFCRDGQPAPRGDSGDILLTRLHAGTMPFIRYAVGDIGRRSLRDSCTCGRNLPLIGAVDGRTSDIVVTPSGQRLVLHFFSAVFGDAETIETFQIHQESPSRIRVLLVPGADFESADWITVRDRILAKGDPDLAIEMELVDSIPTEKSGKRSYIKSSLGE